VQFFFKARPQPQVDVEDSARVRVADIQPVVSVSPWLRPSEPSPPSRRYANIIQSVDHSSSDNETAEDDQEEQLASDAFDQATCEFDAAVDAYIATFRQSSLTISSEDFESVSENISADAAQNAELDLAADVREAMKTWAKFEQISQDVDIDTTSGDAQSDADVLVFADDGCDHLEELVRLSGAGSEAASPPSQPADSLTSPSSLAEAAAMIAQNQMLLAEQSDNMWNVTGAPEAKPSAVSDPVVYHQEANDVWQQQVIQLLMAQHAAHVSPTNASSSPVTAFNSAPQVPPSIKVGTPPTAEFGSGPEPYSVHQVMKRPSGVFDPVKATPTVAPTPSTAAPTPTTSSGKSTPASAQSAAQRAESLKLYLERALGLDVMVDAYTSLHRALETQDVKPEVAVAGIIPPHKLKYVPLLVELIEKEKQC
jgi:predicted DNA binding CopG/RHH family protein